MKGVSINVADILRNLRAGAPLNDGQLAQLAHHLEMVIVLKSVRESYARFLLIELAVKMKESELTEEERGLVAREGVGKLPPDRIKRLALNPDDIMILADMNLPSSQDYWDRKEEELFLVEE